MKQIKSPGETIESHGGNENFNFVQLSRSYLHQMRKLTLCEITGVSRPTVGRAIKLLKDDQWIDTVKIGNANAYCVNERVFWQAGRNQRKYAIFSATVIASATDQRAISKKKPNRN